MVDIYNSKTFTVNQFNGLNLRDGPDYLPIGDTVRGKNFELATSRVLKKRKGITSLYSEYTFPEHAWRAMDYYTDRREVPYYLGVSYPHIDLITPGSGFSTPIFSGLGGMGVGTFIEGDIGDAMWVDSSNAPVYINNGVATQLSWPPVYSNQNKSILNEMPNAIATNPTTFGVDIGYPSLGVYFEGRWWLAGDPLQPQRLYASRLRSTNFADNTDSARIDVAFFVDLFSNSPIVGMKIINNKYLIVFCRNEMHLIQGKFPPTALAPQPVITIEALSKDVGCIGRYAYCEKGDNDIFFISNRKALYTATSTENFQDVRPYGLSEKIYPIFNDISYQRFTRARLINDNIKGELQLWLPEDDRTYYPNKRYVYNYSRDPNTPTWGEDEGFPLSLRGAFLDKVKNKVILTGRTKVYENGTGLTDDGETIALAYEISPLDFGTRDQEKKILKVIITYRLREATSGSITFEHVWDNGKKSGIIKKDLTPTIVAKYGTGKYGASVYASNAGDPIDQIEFEILEPQGVVMKPYITCESEGDLEIVDLTFRYLEFGKSKV